MSPRIALMMFPFLALLVIGFALAPSGPSASAQAQSTIGLVGADAITTGNTATALGPRDACVRTEVGSEVTLDIIVDSVPVDRPMIGFQINVNYDQNLLEPVQASHDLMLGAVGQYQPFPGLSDPLPDSDGNYLVVIADLASLPPSAEDPDGSNMESGKGVLSRVTFRALAPGRSDVGPGYNGNDVYPAIIDPQNTTIGVDAIANTVVAIGEDCGAVPPEEQVTPLPAIDQILGTATPAASGGEGGTPTRTLAPGETPGPTETPDPNAATETPTPGSEGSSTPTPVGLPSAGDDTNTGAVAAAIALAILGAVMAGAGGFILYRRAQAAQGPAAS